MDGIVSLTAIGNCPTNTTAVLANIIAVNAASAGHINVRGYQRSYNGNVTSLNYTAGEVIGNTTLIEVQSQRFKVRPLTTTRIIVDVFGCFTPSSTGGRQLAMYSQPSVRGTTTRSNSGYADISVGGGVGSIALTVADVTSTVSNPAHLNAYKPYTSIPGTSNINLVPGDGISNLMVTPNASVSGTPRIRISRNTSTTGSVTVTVLQLGYFY